MKEKKTRKTVCSSNIFFLNNRKKGRHKKIKPQKNNFITENI
jgi:hypothetical protein